MGRSWRSPSARPSGARRSRSWRAEVSAEPERNEAFGAPWSSAPSARPAPRAHAGGGRRDAASAMELDDPRGGPSYGRGWSGYDVLADAVAGGRYGRTAAEGAGSRPAGVCAGAARGRVGGRMTGSSAAGARVSAGMRGRASRLRLARSFSAPAAVMRRPPRRRDRARRSSATRAGRRWCLRSKDYDVDEGQASVSSRTRRSAEGLRASRRGGGDVIMAFGADGDDAAQTLKGVEKAASNARLFRSKLRQSNVAILWAYR